MEQYPNYLRSIQPELTGHRASQTQNTGFIHTLQNADNQKLDTAGFRTNAQSQIKSLRATLEEQYFDVIVTQSLTAEDFEQIFSTQEARENLQRRKNEMTQHVVKNIRSFLADRTDNQKISIVRQLLTQNFDADLAHNVLTELEKDDK